MITVVGVGLEKGDITIKGRKAIKEAACVFSRVKLWFKTEVLADKFPDVSDYAALDSLIANKVLDAEKQSGNVVYCALGDGFTVEPTKKFGAVSAIVTRDADGGKVSELAQFLSLKGTENAQEIAALVKTHRPERIVMGFPRNMDGSEGPRADLYREFAALLEELQKAEKFIFLEYFIIDEGYMWGSILKILADKAAQGVDVRVLYDGMLEISTLPWDYPRRLEKLGIRCKAFAPIQPFLSTHYNYRDHRKILVIDGKVAFTGGVNLADEYINHVEKYGRWKDAAIMLEGEAVRSLTALFLEMWSVLKEPEFEAFLADPIPVPEHTQGTAAPYGDCPLDGERVGEMVYIDLLNRAREYIHIMTPYLILDGELETALKFAAERGVDVHLILPGIADKKFPNALAKTHYSALLDSGVKISEWMPGGRGGNHQPRLPQPVPPF